MENLLLKWKISYAEALSLSTQRTASATYEESLFPLLFAWSIASGIRSRRSLFLAVGSICPALKASLLCLYLTDTKPFHSEQKQMTLQNLDPLPQSSASFFNFSNLKQMEFRFSSCLLTSICKGLYSTSFSIYFQFILFQYQFIVSIANPWEPGTARLSFRLDYSAAGSQGYCTCQLRTSILASSLRRILCSSHPRFCSENSHFCNNYAKVFHSRLAGTTHNYCRCKISDYEHPKTFNQQIPE